MSHLSANSVALIFNDCSRLHHSTTITVVSAICVHCDLKFYWLCSTGGKSSVLMDIKPWDDETDMKKLEESVRSIELPGLLWGACKISPVIRLPVLFYLSIDFYYCHITPREQHRSNYHACIRPFTECLL